MLLLHHAWRARRVPHWNDNGTGVVIMCVVVSGQLPFNESDAVTLALWLKRCTLLQHRQAKN